MTTDFLPLQFLLLTFSGLVNWHQAEASWSSLRFGDEVRTPAMQAGLEGRKVELRGHRPGLR